MTQVWLLHLQVPILSTNLIEHASNPRPLLKRPKYEDAHNLPTNKYPTYQIKSEQFSSDPTGGSTHTHKNSSRNLPVSN